MSPAVKRVSSCEGKIMFVVKMSLFVCLFWQGWGRSQASLLAGNLRLFNPNHMNFVPSRHFLRSISVQGWTKRYFRMSRVFDIQPIGRFVGQSAAVKRPRVGLSLYSIVCWELSFIRVLSLPFH